MGGTQSAQNVEKIEQDYTDEIGPTGRGFDSNRTTVGERIESTKAEEHGSTYQDHA